jgi:endoglucanase
MFYNVTSNHSINAVFAPKCDYLKLYGVPRSSGLPTFNGSFSHAYVLGTGGPNLGNVNSFVASWNLSNKNLSQFSFQTNNGIPTWFLDLKPKMTNTFSAKSPSCTISGSGIPGLDGTYYVNIIGSDFVMVSKSGNFVIYGSNSVKAPAGCSPTKGAIIEEDDMNNVVDNNVGESLSMYPNPIDKNNAFNINFGRVSSNGAIISIRDLSGKLIYSDILRNNTNSLNLGDKLSSGFYIVRITNDSKQYNVKLIVR